MPITDSQSMPIADSGTLDAFDLNFQPTVKREQIDALHELGFLERRENVVFLGPPGVGKTHLAEEQRNGQELELQDLLLLNHLWMERTITSAAAAKIIQQSQTEARRYLSRLVEHGLVESRSRGRGASYQLSSATYRRLGLERQYVRQRRDSSLCNRISSCFSTWLRTAGSPVATQPSSARFIRSRRAGSWLG